MRFLSLSFLLLLAIACLATARSPQHVGRSLPQVPKREMPVRRAAAAPKSAKSHLTPKTKKFAVNGTGIPDVPFDIGESYAGLLPISNKKNETRELYFWFFPSTNPLAGDEVTIWLNGGPGCSSLEGLLQENGPFLWQYGTFAPVKNPYTWVNLTNMLWVEQPVGTGFSQGVPDVHNEEEVAAQFLGFFKEFLDTFDLKNKKIYITGESYAGMYVPYIADAMLNKNDTKYYDLTGIMIYDPSISSDPVLNEMPSLPFVDYWSGLLSLNDTYLAELNNHSDACGYSAFWEEYFVFPPKGKLPTPPDYNRPGCEIWNDIFVAATYINPCFDEYQVATTCPLLWDVLGFPGSFDYLPEGTSIYFNRSDVQAAINAPQQAWAECSDGVFVDDNDTSTPPALNDILPSVIERTNKTVIGNGALDYIVILNGTLMAIQNMTWNGAQGFSERPNDEFFVPYHSELSDSSLAGSGVFGRHRSERGLTFVEVSLSGHMVPQYAPSAAYRMLEFLLGRIDSLSQTGDFTTQTGNYTIKA